MQQTTNQEFRTCDKLGVCQGRAIPCLTCTRLDADTDPWPGAEDVLTFVEQVICVAIVGAGLGVWYGLVTYLVPVLFG